MTDKEARAILELYNKWRTDGNVPSKYTQPDSKIITEAINVAIKVMS